MDQVEVLIRRGPAARGHVAREGEVSRRPLEVVGGGAGAVGFAAVPAHDRGVVVGGGVDHHVLAERPRPAVVVVVLAEAELEDADAGEAEVVAQLLDVGGDDAQILGDEAGLGGLGVLAQGLEQGAAGGGRGTMTATDIATPQTAMRMPRCAKPSSTSARPSVFNPR